jgi:hypothetical protein
VSPSVPPPNTPHPEPVVLKLPPPSREFSPRLKLVALAALAVLVAGIAIAVLGGAGSTVVDPVAQAATVSATAPGYAMRMSMTISSSASATPITATGRGSFDLRGRTGSMSLTMNLGSAPQVTQKLGSSTLTMQEILTGTTVYVKIPAAVSGALPLGGKQWIAVDLAKVSRLAGLTSLASSNPVSSDPRQMLQYLRAVSGSVLAEGQQRVDGLTTTHYRADINLDRVAGALPEADRAGAQSALTMLEQVLRLHQIPVDVWVDAHHLVRRMTMTMATTLSGGQTLNEGITIDITHYGPEPAPALPPSDQVARLSALLGSGG